MFALLLQTCSLLHLTGPTRHINGGVRLAKCTGCCCAYARRRPRQTTDPTYGDRDAVVVALSRRFLLTKSAEPCESLCLPSLRNQRHSLSGVWERCSGGWAFCGFDVVSTLPMTPLRRAIDLPKAILLTIVSIALFWAIMPGVHSLDPGERSRYTYRGLTAVTPIAHPTGAVDTSSASQPPSQDDRRLYHIMQGLAHRVRPGAPWTSCSDSIPPVWR